MDDYLPAPEQPEGGDIDLNYIDEQDFQPPIQGNHGGSVPSKLDTDDNYLQFDADKDVEHLAGFGMSFHSNNGGVR